MFHFMTTQTRLLRPAEMAQALHISPQYLRELVGAGHITSSERTDGGHRRYTLDDLRRAQAFLHPAEGALDPCATSVSREPAAHETDPVALRWTRAGEVAAIRRDSFEIDYAYGFRLAQLLEGDEIGRSLVEWAAREREAVDASFHAVHDHARRLCSAYSVQIDDARADTAKRLRWARIASVAVGCSTPLLLVPIALAFSLSAASPTLAVMLICLALVLVTVWAIAQSVAVHRKEQAMLADTEQRQFDSMVLGNAGREDHGAIAAAALADRAKWGMEAQYLAHRRAPDGCHGDPLRMVPSQWAPDSGGVQTWSELELLAREVAERADRLELVERPIRDYERLAPQLRAS
jgi:hypothetical protein